MTRGVKLAIVGDSVFDNGVYVEKGEPAVHEQVGRLLEPFGSVVMGAKDGGVIATIRPQLRAIAKSKPTHIVMSVGGNDALMYAGLTRSRRTQRVDEILDLLVDARHVFAQRYALLVEYILRTYQIPTIVSTIYYPTFSIVSEQERAIVLLSLFNDAILSVAATHSLPVLDLRWVSTKYEHYANPIEPSAYGGERIAETIVRIVTEHDFNGPSVVYVHPDAAFDPQPFTRSPGRMGTLLGRQFKGNNGTARRL